MSKNYTSRFYTFRLVAFVLFLFAGIHQQAQAQCPIPASCTPGTATNTQASLFGTGIFNVRIGTTINNTTLGAIQGYQNYCALGMVACPVGSAVAISIRNGTSVDENVRVWCDLNNDGSFDPVTELLFSSNSKKQHTGTITLPSTAVLNTPLRLRISSDAIVAASLPGVCSTPEYSQVEDYSVRATVNVIPPKARFFSPDSSSCNLAVRFTDASSNSPTKWMWWFGDGDTSTAQNPVHNYAGSGSYTVKLKVSSQFGSDSLTKVNYINLNDTVPVAATCNAITVNQCCGYGISRVVFNTIDNSSTNGSYQDFTCTRRTTLIQSQNYTLSLTTNPNLGQDTKAWIDYNNNGLFENWELVYESTNQINPSGNIRIADTGVVLNKALRMRIISDFAGSAIEPCGFITNGQCEDYTVLIKGNTLPPVAGFVVANGGNFCQSSYTFVSTTQNVVTSYRWKIGSILDSTTTSSTFTYTIPQNGVFDVTLFAIGPFGKDSITIKNAVMNFPQMVTPCASQSQNGPNIGVGIGRVIFNTINKKSGTYSEGYKDFTCTERTVVTAGSNYLLTVVNSSQNTENVRVWIDYNNSGTFENSEQILSSDGDTTHNKLITISATALQNIPLRMRVLSWRPNGPGGQTPGACGNIFLGQAEDYAVIIAENFSPPIAAFNSEEQVSCTGFISFTNTSLNAPTSFKWKFGDGDSSTVENPTHYYKNIGFYSVSLEVSNAFGVNTLVQSNFVYITDTTKLLAATCKPASANLQQGLGPTSVSFGSINNSSSTTPTGYEDFSCTSKATVTMGNSYPLSIQFQGNPQSVRVWIDLNDNANFETGEIIFTGNNAISYNANITIPSNATVSKGLRMRVLSDFGQAPASACNNPNFGQCEDYQIWVLPSTQAPVANFLSSDSVSCYRKISFSDLSSFGPAKWRWKFGDGDTSTLQNPVHEYAADGNYTVELEVSNGFGVSTKVKTNYIKIQNSGSLLPPPCKPQTTTVAPNNPGFGITNVKIGTINNTTAATDFGYKDFSCGIRTDITLGGAFTYSVTTNQTQPQSETVRIWIDWNNNGIFDLPAEQAITSQNRRVHTGNITPPNNVVTNVPIRIRIMSEISNLAQNLQPCNNVQFGQTEDYALVFKPLSDPPKANFFALTRTSCSGSIAFRDSSSNFPTQWLWDFGDGVGTANVRNPIYRYTATGLYTVKLKVSNGIGTDSIVKTNYINVTDLNGPTAASCFPATQSPSNNFGITNVSFNTINRSSGLSVEGYRDFTCTSSTTVLRGNSYTLNITTSVGNAQERVTGWIDWNNDGNIGQNGERLNIQTQNGRNHTVTFNIPGTATLRKALRMRLISDQVGGAPIQNSCSNPNVGQCEDYSVVVDTTLANDEMLELQNDMVFYPNPTQGTVYFETSLNTPNSWTLMVLNATGQLMLEERHQAGLVKGNISIENYPAGLYTFILKTEDKIKRHQIIKN